MCRLLSQAARCTRIGVGLRDAMQGTDLVARRITQVSQVQLDTRPFTNTGRIFTVCATIGQASFMPGISLSLIHI